MIHATRSFENGNPIRSHSAIVSVFSVLVLLIVWATMTTLLRWQWQETMEAQKRQNTNTSVALKEHTLRIIDTVDQAIARLQDGVRAGGLRGEDIVRITNETGMAPQILTQLSIIDAEGRFVGSNLDPDGSRSRNINLMDRDHVRVHLEPTLRLPQSTGMLRQGLFISKPVLGKVSGKISIQLSRKIESGDGRPLGVVVASLNQSYFAEVYRGVQLGSEGDVVLAGLDGVIRVRVVGGDNAGDHKPLPESLVDALLQHSHGATVSSSSDGMERITGFSRVGEYPLVVLSGTSHNQTFAAWRATRNTVLALTALLSLVVVAFVIMFLGSIRRLADSHAALIQNEALAQGANQAKSEFLAAMSHELRTPLTSIRGFAELMELRSTEPMIREQSGLIRQGAEHLNALLTEILDLAKIEAGAMPIHVEPVELHALVQDAVELFRISAVAKSLALTTTFDSAVPTKLVTDRLRLKQVLNNLLSNAIKFTDEGSVCLALELSIDRHYLLFHVLDTGPGIPISQHEVIFEKFSQGNGNISYQHGGTGLGLSLSRALAELLGGTLVVESRLNEGAQFTLSLPIRLS